MFWKTKKLKDEEILFANTFIKHKDMLKALVQSQSDFKMILQIELSKGSVLERLRKQEEPKNLLVNLSLLLFGHNLVFVLETNDKVKLVTGGYNYIHEKLDFRSYNHLNAATYAIEKIVQDPRQLDIYKPECVINNILALNIDSEFENLKKKIIQSDIYKDGLTYTFKNKVNLDDFKVTVYFNEGSDVTTYKLKTTDFENTNHCYILIGKISAASDYELAKLIINHIKIAHIMKYLLKVGDITVNSSDPKIYPLNTALRWYSFLEERSV